jgi:AIR synthase-related protein
MLTELLHALRLDSGLQQKTEIQMVAEILNDAFPPPFPNGDDAAILPVEGGFDLFSGEGFMDEFVATDPWFAGWCGVMVNASDIAAMGGKPVAVVNALWGGHNTDTRQILAGMAAASKAYQVPIVGGHTNLRSAQPRLAVSILGRARKVLSSFDACSGQHLVAAIDLRGHYRLPFNNWNAATNAPPERLRGDLALLPIIAEQQLASAAKDISQAGLLGTCVMLLESAQLGATIDLSAIPKPVEVEWHQWLQSFPSFGFLLSCHDDALPKLLESFHGRDIAAASIGRLNDSGQCRVNFESDTEVFWDLNTTPLTTMGVSHA